ncbi:hypothetical protein TSOC_003811 [Tetrabaena socialis]|uniref:Exostosin GT47 domain-containing protein n=1 Tax=Tetrabaena socialis TaxID=47790 RepID=A0A2J8AAN6_9CHLO|nr:hypothetical protein TSOC_003811 [Tetrabaena socialis]|eukprot:PNH09581.1 hypothetical protein TSOC_003811 [Tetrabaena socialis]
MLTASRSDASRAIKYDHMVGCRKAPVLYRQLLDAGGEAPARDLLFYFAGSVRAFDPSYSGGVRQALAEHLKGLLASAGNFSDIKFIDGGVPDYEQLYLRSKFCLAPHGSGFGVRLTLAMAHGCIPVIIQPSRVAA